VKSPQWYASGYTAADPGNLTSYRNYVAEVVSRYAGDPTILMWQLMNEAESRDLAGDCTDGGAVLLHNFATDVSGLIKSIDPNHLVSLGTLGGSQCGQHRHNFGTVHDVATIDVCEFHDYSPLEAMPTDVREDGYDNGLATRIQICHDLGKPIFVGESGIPNSIPVAGSVVPRSIGLSERAKRIRAKVQAQFHAGVVGYLAWTFNDGPEGLDDRYEIMPGDPALAELRVPIDAPGFVTADGPQLMTDGNPWYLHGASTYHTTNRGGPNDPDQIIGMAQDAGLNTLRIGEMFHQYATGYPEESGPPSHAPYDEADWARTDRFLDKLREAGLRAILDLSAFRNFLVHRDIAAGPDYTRICTDGIGVTVAERRSVLDQISPYRTDVLPEWDTFINFVANRVNTVNGLAYKDDPTIAIVSFAGEAGPPDSLDCGRAHSGAELTNFYDRVFTKWKTLDQTHLLSNGGLIHLDWAELHGDTDGSGINWQDIFSLQGNDIPSIHTYPARIDDGVPADFQSPKVSAFLADLGKPWFTEEFGWQQGVSDATRAANYRWLYGRQQACGSAGAAFWNLGNELAGGTFDVNPGTPLAFGAVQQGGTGDVTPAPICSFGPVTPGPTNWLELQFNITFNEPITDLDATDFTIGGTSSGWFVKSLEGSGRGPYVITLAEAGTTDGTVALTLGANTIASDSLPAAAVTTPRITIDRTGPMVALARSPSTDPSNASGFVVTATWTEPVNAFDASDVSVAGATISGFTGSGADYSWSVTPTADGPVSSGVTADATRDALGNPSLGTSLPVWTSDRTAPTVTTPSLNRTTAPHGAPVIVNATAADARGVASADVSVAGGPWLSMTAVDAAFGGTSEAVTRTVTMSPPPGPVSICVRATDAAANVSAGTACRSLTVVKANQTITFANPGNKTMLTTTIVAAPTASSNLPVTLTTTSASSICTADGVTITVVGPGSCAVTASQPGDVNYNAAPNVTRTFTITKANQTITFATITAKTMAVSSFNVAPTASSGLDVAVATTSAGSICTVSDRTINLVGPGSCAVTASQPGDNRYNAAPNVTRTFTISKLNQTITFPAIPNKTLATSTVTVAPTVTSGLPILVATSSPSSVCTVTDNTISIAGPGSCAVTASQPGNTTYNPAPNVTRTFTISKVSQTITFAAIPNKTLATVSFDVAPTTSAAPPLAVAISTTSSSSICTVAGMTITLIGPGSCAITASQPGDGYYAAAPNVTRTFTITKANQTITFVNPGTRTMAQSPLTLSGTASSGYLVTFTTSTPLVCTSSGANGATLTFVATGTCTVIANQAGDSRYNAAAAVTRSFAVR
jgi:endo-1,4-beta-mannosidase